MATSNQYSGADIGDSGHAIKNTMMTQRVKITDFLPVKFNSSKLDCDAESHSISFRDYLNKSVYPIKTM